MGLKNYSENQTGGSWRTS